MTLAAYLHPFRFATTRVSCLATSVLDCEDPAFDRVHQDVLGFKVRIVAPRAKELDRVAFRMAIEEAGLLDGVAGGVLGEAGDVDDAEA